MEERSGSSLIADRRGCPAQSGSPGAQRLPLPGQLALSCRIVNLPRKAGPINRYLCAANGELARPWTLLRTRCDGRRSCLRPGTPPCRFNSSSGLPGGLLVAVRNDGRAWHGSTKDGKTAVAGTVDRGAGTPRHSREDSRNSSQIPEKSGQGVNSAGSVALTGLPLRLRITPRKSDGGRSSIG